MTARQLEVSVNDQLVGNISEENDLWRFEYSQRWIESQQGFDLSPALPRAAGLHMDGASNRPVQWYFDNLLPEENLRQVLAKEAQLNSEDIFGLLAYFGSESAGSLVLRDPGKANRPEYGLRLLLKEKLNQRIINLPNISLTKDAPKRMSLAGAQHKMLIVFKNGQLYEPLSGTPSTHILKPNHKGADYPASVMNEFFTMRLAQKVGLDVPNVYRIYTPEPVYIVERFDRILPKNQDPDDVQRRHVIDACQLLNKARTFKYTAAHLETLAHAIEYCRSKAAARMQLFRWVLFNVLVGNGDNHLKNISFIVDSNGINVAPAYDLLSTAVYETRAFANERANWPNTHLAFSIGEAKTFADVNKDHILLVAKSLGVMESTAKRELVRMLGSLPKETDKLIDEITRESEKDIVSCPDPTAARTYIGVELRVLKTIKHIVLPEMCRQLT